MLLSSNVFWTDIQFVVQFRGAKKDKNRVVEYTMDPQLCKPEKRPVLSKPYVILLEM